MARRHEGVAQVRVPDVLHDPVGGRLEAGVVAEVERLLAGRAGEAHLQQLRHQDLIEDRRRRGLAVLGQGLLARLHARAADGGQVQFIGHLHGHVQLLGGPVLLDGELLQVDEQVVRERRQPGGPANTLGSVFSKRSSLTFCNSKNGYYETSGKRNALVSNNFRLAGSAEEAVYALGLAEHIEAGCKLDAWTHHRDVISATMSNFYVFRGTKRIQCVDQNAYQM